MSLDWFDSILIAEHMRGSESGVEAFRGGLQCKINTFIIVWMYGMYGIGF